MPQPLGSHAAEEYCWAGTGQRCCHGSEDSTGGLQPHHQMLDTPSTATQTVSLVPWLCSCSAHTSQLGLALLRLTAGGLTPGKPIWYVSNSPSCLSYLLISLLLGEWKDKDRNQTSACLQHFFLSCDILDCAQAGQNRIAHWPRCSQRRH